MTARQPCPPAPGPLELYAAAFDGCFRTLAQRRGFRAYLAGLLLPRDRNKTLTALAGAEPVVGAQGAAVQRLQFWSRLVFSSGFALSASGAPSRATLAVAGHTRILHPLLTYRVKGAVPRAARLVRDGRR